MHINYIYIHLYLTIIKQLHILMKINKEIRILENIESYFVVINAILYLSLLGFIIGSQLWK